MVTDAPARSGYSGKALHQKLGFRPGDTLLLHHAPSEYFTWLELPPEALTVVGPEAGPQHHLHAFVESLAELPTLDALRPLLRPEGQLWVSWRKGKQGEVKEDHIRRWALDQGLVDVKVCAVSEAWSGLKLVWRKERR